MTETYRLAFPPPHGPSASTHTYVTYGLAFPEATAKHTTSGVFIIASKSISTNTDALDRLKSALGDKVIGCRIGILPHTPWDDLLEIVNYLKDRKDDVKVIVTLGAGSLTDGAKIIALALANDAYTTADFEKLTHAGENDPSTVKPCKIKVFCIPTSLSAGEYSSLGGGTDTRTHMKYPFRHPSVAPSLVILDPVLSITTPEWVWLSTGVRSIDHCVEGICSTTSCKESDIEAEEGLRLLVPGLLRCKKNPKDEEARLNCMKGANAAIASLGWGVELGGSHAIGHQLGPLGVGHGETSCILLPAVMKYNASKNQSKQDKVREILWSEPEVRACLEKRHIKEEADAGDYLDAIFRELGQPRCLATKGIGADKLDALAENSLKDHWSATNPIPLVKKEQILEILNAVLN